MHVLVIGGSGKTGSQVIELLLDQGHTVTALARNPSTIVNGSKIDLERGTPANKEDLERCFSRQTPDAVVVTLTSSTEAPNGALLTFCVTTLVSLMKKHGTQRIVYMSAWGVDDSYPDLNRLMKLLISMTKLATEFSDHKGAEQALKASEKSEIKWTVVRPVMLKNGQAKEVRSMGDHGEKVDSFMPGITRASVAKFMVDALENEKWFYRTPIICN